MSKVLLSLPEELLKEIDETCLRDHYERSEFIRNCIRSEIQATNPIAKPSGLITPKLYNALSTATPINIKRIPKKLLKDMVGLQKAFSNMAGMCKHGSAIGNCKFGCTK